MKKIIFALAFFSLCVIGLTAIALANNQNGDYGSSNTNINNLSDIAKPDSIENLTQNENFVRHGYQVTELEEETKINKATAIEKVKEFIGEKTFQEAENITAVKVKFTDTETPQPSDSTNIILKDYPVWIVTFYGVTVYKSGPTGGTVLADHNIVVDANSGEILEGFAYSHK